MGPTKVLNCLKFHPLKITCQSPAITVLCQNYHCAHDHACQCLSETKCAHYFSHSETRVNKVKFGVPLMGHREKVAHFKLGHVLAAEDNCQASDLLLLHKFYTRYLKMTEGSASVMIQLSKFSQS